MQRDDTTTDITKLPTQVSREFTMQMNGKNRWEKRASKSKFPESIKLNQHKISTSAIPKVSGAISNAIKYGKQMEGTRNPVGWYADLKKCDTETLAYIGLNCFMDAVGLNSTRTTLLAKIGHRIELQIWSEDLKSFNKTYAKLVETVATKVHTSLRHRKEAARKLASRLPALKDGTRFTFKPWDTEKKVKVSQVIYNAVIEFSDIFDTYDFGASGKTSIRMTMLPEASQNLANMDWSLSWATPEHAPMTAPPRHWESFTTGCYFDPALAASVTLVRAASSDQKRQIVHQFSRGVPLWVQALNIIQATPYTINSFVLKAVDWAYTENKDLKKFPSINFIPLPPKISSEEWEALNTIDRAILKNNINGIKTTNLEITGSKVVMGRDLATAKELLNYPEFFLPWNLCTRGRAYIVPHFSYHRADYIKSLFLFKRGGKLLENDGLKWLKIHTANTGDFDKISKVSFEEREKWTEENMEWIIECGRDFKATYDIWAAADKPFCFLAAARELYLYSLDPDHISLLPVSLDGSNSGLQHYSLSSKSENDGKLTNLIPTDLPQDFYQVIADRANEDIIKSLGDTSKMNNSATLTIGEIAARWQKFGVGRAETKRNSMCFVYSSKVFGLAEQLMEDFMIPIQKSLKLTKSDQPHPFGDTYFEHQQCAQWLARVNYKNISVTVSSAAFGMDFIQNLTDTLSSENKHLSFVNPIGFPFVQHYTKWINKKIRMYLFDRVSGVKKVSQTTLVRGTSNIDKRRSRNACAPNIIHSMDSCHLLSSVLSAPNIKDWFLIHDSFGVPANQIAGENGLYMNIRHSLVDMYEDYCLYSDIQEQARHQLKNPADGRLLPIPEKGNLVISELINSKYCFS